MLVDFWYLAPTTINSVKIQGVILPRFHPPLIETTLPIYYNLFHSLRPYNKLLWYHWLTIDLVQRETRILPYFVVLSTFIIREQRITKMDFLCQCYSSLLLFSLSLLASSMSVYWRGSWNHGKRVEYSLKEYSIIQVN